MAHCLSNLQISHPISTSTSPKPNSRIPKFFLNPVVGSNKRMMGSIRAEAAAGNGSHGSLDHLQRAGNKIQQQQQQQPLTRQRRAPQSAAPLGLWDRFPTARTVQQMMETMDRLIEDPYGGTWVATLPSDGSGYSSGRTPWEIVEAEGEYKMRFDMPGMRKEDVKVWIEDKMLVVKAEKQEESKVEKENGDAENGGLVWSAKSYGKYSSRIALPDNIQFEKISAEVKDGVLYISIPKASRSSKVLDINVG